MKPTLFLAVLFTGVFALAANSNQSYSFKYEIKEAKAKSVKHFSISRSAGSKEEAFKLAARDCFQKLTGNSYPGEEKGLEIIDICANPKM